MLNIQTRKEGKASVITIQGKVFQSLAYLHVVQTHRTPGRGAGDTIGYGGVVQGAGLGQAKPGAYKAWVL